MSLPTDRDARNALPVWDGCIAYFPDAWAEIAKVSVIGNKQHALGAKLHFARDVSTDHLNKVMRHCLDHEAGNVLDTDGTMHLAKAAWRVLAALQVAIEAQRAKVPGVGAFPGQLSDKAVEKLAERPTPGPAQAAIARCGSTRVRPVPCCLDAGHAGPHFHQELGV